MGMAKVTFTANIQRHVECPEVVAAGATLREVLDRVFEQHLRARSYFLDDQAGLRTHIAVFIDGQLALDRRYLTDPVAPHSNIFVAQALSGG